MLLRNEMLYVRREIFTLVGSVVEEAKGYSPKISQKGT